MGIIRPTGKIRGLSGAELEGVSFLGLSIVSSAIHLVFLVPPTFWDICIFG